MKNKHRKFYSIQKLSVIVTEDWKADGSKWKKVSSYIALLLWWRRFITSSLWKATVLL